MRTDISNWVIHFIHRRNPETDPSEFHVNQDTFEPLDHPDGFTYDGEPLFLAQRHEEEEWGLEPDASAFGVLRKILHDGYLKAGWSYRRTRAGIRPTIYGPKAAVCFTEMPLHGLIEYAKSRASEYTVESYGIAFLREELFQAGARQVIYGLSSPHREADKQDQFWSIGLRTLHSELGIGLREQYRYVATNPARNIDWTHEREWRWADVEERFQEPGMHFFLENDYHRFSKLIIIVQRDNEVEHIVDHLRSLYDTGSDNYGREYNKAVIKNTSVLSIESLSTLAVSLDNVRLDDLPVRSIPKIRRVVIQEEVLRRVDEAITEAKQRAHAASEAFYAQHGDCGPSGFSNVVTFDGHSEITQALLKLEHARAIGGEYIMYGITGFPVQSIDVNEAGAKAAAKYLTETLGQPFYERTRWD